MLLQWYLIGVCDNCVVVGPELDVTLEQSDITGYPIRMPASTVAKVCDDDLRIPKTLSEYGDFGEVNLTSWLRKHTQETP